MATRIDYRCNDSDNILDLLETNSICIGYVKEKPEDVFRQLIKEYFVVDYLGVEVPSKSEYNNLNIGIKLSEIDDGIGLDGNIANLNESEQFRGCYHGPFSKEERKMIYDIMIRRLAPIGDWSEPKISNELEDYVTIFDALGFPMTAQEISKITVHPDYGQFRENGGIINPDEVWPQYE